MQPTEVHHQRVGWIVMALHCFMLSCAPRTARVEAFIQKVQTKSASSHSDYLGLNTIRLGWQLPRRTKPMSIRWRAMQNGRLIASGDQNLGPEHRSAMTLYIPQASYLHEEHSTAHPIIIEANMLMRKRHYTFAKHLRWQLDESSQRTVAMEPSIRADPIDPFTMQLHCSLRVQNLSKQRMPITQAPLYIRLAGGQIGPFHINTSSFSAHEKQQFEFQILLSEDTHPGLAQEIYNHQGEGYAIAVQPHPNERIYPVAHGIFSVRGDSSLFDPWLGR